MKTDIPLKRMSYRFHCCQVLRPDSLIIKFKVIRIFLVGWAYEVARTIPNRIVSLLLSCRVERPDSKRT